MRPLCPGSMPMTVPSSGRPGGKDSRTEEGFATVEVEVERADGDTGVRAGLRGVGRALEVGVVGVVELVAVARGCGAAQPATVTPTSSIAHDVERA